MVDLQAGRGGSVINQTKRNLEMTIKIEIDLTNATVGECAELAHLTFVHIRDNRRVLNVEWREITSAGAGKAQALEDLLHHPACR